MYLCSPFFVLKVLASLKTLLPALQMSNACKGEEKGSKLSSSTVSGQLTAGMRDKIQDAGELAPGLQLVAWYPRISLCTSSRNTLRQEATEGTELCV